MIYRQEHPKPQFERSTWQNLNGEWDFAIDYDNCGEGKKFFEVDKKLEGKIIVPFAPESTL